MKTSRLISIIIALVSWAVFSFIYLNIHGKLSELWLDNLYLQLFLLPILVAAVVWPWWSVWITGIISTFIIFELRYSFVPSGSNSISSLPLNFWAPVILTFLQSLVLGLVIQNKESRNRALRDDMINHLADINRQQEQFSKSETLLESLRKNNLKLSSMIMSLTTHLRLLNEKLLSEEIIRTGIEAIQKSINADYCAIYLAPPQYAMLVLTEERGTPQGDPLPKEVPFGQGMLGRVAKLQQTSKQEEAFAMDSDVNSQSLRSMTVAIPISFLHKTLGAIYVEKSAAVRDEIFILETLASFIGMALHNAEVVREKKIEAMTDGLTKLYNHEYFLEHLRNALANAQRYRHTLSLIMLDVDHFKHYNDTNGHQMGDIVLEDVARVIKNSVRGADIAARYGGEEFAVILPETDIQGAAKVADKIRIAISEHNFPNRTAQPLGIISCSVGVGTVNGTISSPEELIDTADQALYRAKNNGRNRVELAPQPVTPEP